MAFIIPVALFVVIILSTTIEAAIPSSQLADLPAFVKDDYVYSFSEEEKRCHQSKKVFYAGNCYYIGQQGPCQEDEWLVYDRKKALHGDGTLKAVCERKPCPSKYRFVTPDNKCYHDEDIANGICPKRFHIKTNLFGGSFCSCRSHQATLMGGKRKKCHDLYTQGPCQKGSLFLPVLDLVNFGFGQCLPSACASEGRRLAEIRLANGQKECFELLRQGPCRHAQYLDMDDTASFPGIPHFTCKYKLIYLTTAVPMFSKSDGCVENDNGDCVKTLKFTPLEPEPFYFDEI